MSLKDKYLELVNAATASGVANLLVREQDGVVYIDGEAPSNDVKQKLWDVYDKIDPGYSSGDLIMNITVAQGAVPQEYEVVKGDNLTKIGKKFGVRWEDIYKANKGRITNPDHIEPGWKLKIPG